MSTKLRYLHADQVLPMLQPQSRIMRLVGFFADHYGDTMLANILYFSTAILFYSPL